MVYTKDVGAKYLLTLGISDCVAQSDFGIPQKKEKDKGDKNYGI